MTKKEFLASLRSICLGAFSDKENNECILYVDFNDEKQCMEVGTACNSGFIIEFEVAYDDGFSIDGNLENLMEECYSYGFESI